MTHKVDGVEIILNSYRNISRKSLVLTMGMNVETQHIY